MKLRRLVVFGVAMKFISAFAPKLILEIIILFVNVNFYLDSLALIVITLFNIKINSEKIKSEFKYAIIMLVGSCVDTSNGKTDSLGEGCGTSIYDEYPNTCGSDDSSEFNSTLMCCSCNGGSSIGNYRRSRICTIEIVISILPIEILLIIHIPFYKKE